jgi:hypothetical protein
MSSRILPSLAYRYLIDYKDCPQNTSRSGTRLNKIPLIPHLRLQLFDKHPLDYSRLAVLAEPMLTTQKYITVSTS